jgi:hypothetical protein
MSRNTARGTPAKVLILFALLTGVMVVAAWRDSLRRTDLERVTWPTATGDSSFHQPGGPPLELHAQGSLFTLEELPGERLQQRDDHMFRVPLAIPVPRLYTTSETWPPHELPPLYLKTAPGEFLKVILQKPETRP